MRVTLPLCAPGIRAGAILVFVPCLGTYLTSDLLGGSKTVLIGNLVQNQFTTARDWPFGAAVSLALMVVAIAAAVRGARGGARSCYEARAGGLRRGRLCVPARAAADPGGLQLQCFALHGVARILAALVSGGVRRSRSDRIRGEQPDHRRRRDRARDRHRNAGGLRAVETRLGVAVRIAVSFAGDAGDRDGRLAAGVVSVDLPVSASAAGDAHGDSGARGVLAGLRGRRGAGAAAQLRSGARRSRARSGRDRVRGVPARHAAVSGARRSPRRRCSPSRFRSTTT